MKSDRKRERTKASLKSASDIHKTAGNIPDICCFGLWENKTQAAVKSICIQHAWHPAKPRSVICTLVTAFISLSQVVLLFFGGRGDLLCTYARLSTQGSVRTNVALHSTVVHYRDHHHTLSFSLSLSEYFLVWFADPNPAGGDLHEMDAGWKWRQLTECCMQSDAPCWQIQSFPSSLLNPVPPGPNTPFTTPTFFPTSIG